VRELGEKLLTGGPEKLNSSERMTVMADQRVMVWLGLILLGPIVEGLA